MWESRAALKSLNVVKPAVLPRSDATPLDLDTAPHSDATPLDLDTGTAALAAALDVHVQAALPHLKDAEVRTGLSHAAADALKAELDANPGGVTRTWCRRLVGQLCTRQQDAHCQLMPDQYPIHSHNLVKVAQAAAGTSAAEAMAQFGVVA